MWIDFFYYIGIIFIVSCVIDLFKQEMIDVANTVNNGIDSISEGDLHSAIASRNKLLKNKFDIFIGLLMFFWMAIGILSSDQKIFFIILFFNAIICLPLILKTIKNKQQIFANINNIISICIVLIMLYNHFLKIN